MCGKENADCVLVGNVCVGLETVVGAEEPKSPSISSTVLFCARVGEDTVKDLSKEVFIGGGLSVRCGVSADGAPSPN